MLARIDKPVDKCQEIFDSVFSFEDKEDQQYMSAILENDDTFQQTMEIIQKHFNLLVAQETPDERAFENGLKSDLFAFIKQK